ncbi:aldo/keto reductase [Litorisediminicola beolgyonensis]|uniref:Aldo/keto reductase n=1 Tax=Litorisediminicola beolgyonensis TaxID=1173614 RepID=A0ABW3ZH11_9RHOB
MKMNPLGRTGLSVSELCLGTMTYGNQTPESDAHSQIEMALEAGINFLDTAEMYPVNPVRKESIGRTEEVIGNWFAKTGRRSDWIVATKITGQGQEAVRDGAPITPETLDTALEGSLRRLQTDMVDLYQLHWPNRGSYAFRQNWSYAPEHQDAAATRQNMADVLGWMERQVERGTIRFFGLSNETTWGTSEWLRIAAETSTPRVASIQNEYSLLCRLADTDLAELMVNEDVGLLPYSPLAAGLLTGKYQGGAVPEGSRRSLNETLGGRINDRVFGVVEEYLAVAREFGLDPSQMALAWSARRPFVASSILGATTTEQLSLLLGAAEVTLEDDLLARLDAVNRAHPMPI